MRKNKGDYKSSGVNGQNERNISCVFLRKSKWNDLKTHKKSNCNEYFRFACHKTFFIIYMVVFCLLRIRKRFASRIIIVQVELGA